MSILGPITVDANDAGGCRVGAAIGEEWGIAFAQGGVVMAQMLRAAEAVDDRPDLQVASAAATFLRPVPCGPVAMQVDVLRGGRNGAQVEVDLFAGDGIADAAPGPNARMVIVSTAAGEGWPELTGTAMAADLLRVGPGGGVRMGVEPDGRATSAFFATTQWHAVEQASPSPLRRLAWFSFGAHGEDDTWDPALVPVPADALGMAAVPPVSELMGLLTSPSLQLTIQFHSPARGPWVGIDSRCLHTATGVASGVATLWNADGTLVATAVQTAILRPI